MKRRLRILHFEENLGDAELVRLTLEYAGIACDLLRVENRPAFAASLEKGGFDLILADYSPPRFEGLFALAVAREWHPDLPFVFVSGSLGDETAVELLKNGATDYVPKSRVSRLAPVILRALREAQVRREHRRAMEEIKALHDVHLALTSTLDLATVLQIVLSKIDLFLPRTAAHVAEIDGAGMRLIACRDLDETQWQSEPVWRSTVQTVLESRRPVIIRNLPEDGAASPGGFYRREGLVSYLGKSLTVNGEVIGALSLLTKQEHEFTNEEIDFAERLAELAGLAIYNRRLREQAGQAFSGV